MTEPAADKKHKNLVREGTKGLGVVVVLILLMMWLSGAFVRKVGPGPPVERPQPGKVVTCKAERQVYPLVLEQVGTVRAQVEAQVSSRIMAQVKEILVREGDRVAGAENGGSPTIIARLDDRDIQARLRQAESQVVAMSRAGEVAKAKLASSRAQVESARANRDNVVSDYGRYEDLQRHQAATGQQLEHARAQKAAAEAQFTSTQQDVQAAQGEIARTQAQREQAEASVAEARAMLAHTVIQAPFTGQVIRKMVNVGDMASPGQPLFFLETPMRPELHVHLSESLLPHLKTGQDLRMRIDALDRVFSGNLREIVPKSDPTTRTVLVKVSLSPDPDLVNGMFGRLEVPYGKYETIVVPSRAVREVGQLRLVEVLDREGYPQRQFVTLGEAHGDLVEVLSGLRENEEVVLP